MFTIKQTARLTGVPEATLRTWEKRYGVVTPDRTDAGYRLYDNHAVSTLTAMRKLVEAGWTPAQAAQALREGKIPLGSPVGEPQGEDRPGDATAYLERFLAGAAAMDAVAIQQALDRGFSLGSFEHVVDAWLCPSLVALGEGWARGEIDIAGEHAASHAVLRRLATAYEAAGSRSRGPAVVVGLPPGSAHELGALAFATACRRLGLDVLYLGADVPATSWEAAVRNRSARAAVLGVVTAADRPAAASTAELLLSQHPSLLVATGGAFGASLLDGTATLPWAVSDASVALDALLHGEQPSS